MYFLTRTCGLLFLAAALLVIIFGIVDTAPEASAAADELREGNHPLPIATTVKYKIGSEVLFDVITLTVLALFGWFLWTSEIQQTWAVVITLVLVAGSVVIRVTPVLPIDVARHSPGIAFWGALVIDDFYPAPLAPNTQYRGAMTFPINEANRLVVSERGLSGQEPHPDSSTVLNFAQATSQIARFYSQGGGQVTGKLAGTRTILDYDHEKAVYTVPHMMVVGVAEVGARNAASR